MTLSVTVTDRDERLLSNLRADEFRILEDGVQQPLTFFAAEPVPLDLAMLVDGSASMRENMDIVRRAALGLARTLRPHDRATIVEFRDGVQVRQALTSDAAAIERAIQSIRPSGGTALYNAVGVALDMLRRVDDDDRQVRRQAIVVISDGEDTSSVIDYDDLLDRARHAGVTIYPIALTSAFIALGEQVGDNGRHVGERDFAMRTLAEETGGEAFFPQEIKDLRPIYERIASELGHQYSLGYLPRNQRRDGEWRRVQVEIPARPGVRPRTRRGYFAATATRDLLSSLRAIVVRGQQ